MLLRFLDRLHQLFIFPSRRQRIAQAIALHLRTCSSVLDIGCGDGSIAAEIRKAIPVVAMSGVEVKLRASCAIPCRIFDGHQLPFPDHSFDACLLIDVLHHTNNVQQLLYEARRVSRDCIIIKDHVYKSASDHFLLRAMDWFGNRAHDVPLVNNYLRIQEWTALLEGQGFRIRSWDKKFSPYRSLLDRVFGKGLHCLIVLDVK